MASFFSWNQDFSDPNVVEKVVAVIRMELAGLLQPEQDVYSAQYDHSYDADDHFADRDIDVPEKNGEMQVNKVEIESVTILDALLDSPAHFDLKLFLDQVGWDLMVCLSIL